MLLLLVWTQPGYGSLEVADDRGKPVTLERAAQRIVSLAPHITELLFAVGAGEQLVGVVQYSNYPQAAKNVTRVGSYAQLDLEAITALDPELIVAWGGGNPEGQVVRLGELGFAVYINDPRRIEDVPRSLERLGRLAGRQAAGQRAAAEFRRQYTALARQYRDRPGVRVFYEIWNRPLMTVNGEHLISDVIALCGGSNVFASLPVLAPAIALEDVLAADPEVIIASGMGQQRPEWLDSWRRWPQLKAVRGENLYSIPPDIIQRHGPRILEGATQMCVALEQARAKRDAADPRAARR